MSIWEKSGNLGHVHFCVHLNDFFRNGAFLIKNRTVSITYQARHVSNSKRCVLCPKITLFRLRTKPDMSAIRNGAFFVQKSPCFDYVPSQTCHQFETVCFWSKNTPFGYISFHSEGDVRVCTSTSLYSNICRGCISQVRAAS